MSNMESARSAIEKGSTPIKAAEAFSLILTRSGGIQGLIQKFENAGLGSVIQSWIGHGQNIPLHPDQMRTVIGEETLQQISQKVDLQPEDLLHKLVQYLPQAVDSLTPNGYAQEEQFSTDKLLSMGKNLFH